MCVIVFIVHLEECVVVLLFMIFFFFVEVIIGNPFDDFVRLFNQIVLDDDQIIKF